MTKPKPDDTPATEPVAPPADAAAPDSVAAAEPARQPAPISEVDAEKVVLRYVGPGNVSGIPDRDLTVLDIERLTPAQIRDATVAAPGRRALYEAV